ncbi:MAG TPA: type 4a pilus biogenesis protein PilO [Lacunisphaera sp.]|nr:type 4a pilus biogenesis protein PilO [Lacunisphaera sp.]
MIFLAQFWAAIRLNPGTSACLAVALLAGLVNYPLWQQRDAATFRHAEIRLRGETMLAALTDRSRIDADLAVLTEAHEVIERNLVSELSMEVNLGYFYRLEKINRVRLARIDQLGTAQSSDEAPFKTVPITLQVSGTYRNLLGFMRDLETGPRILRTRSYRLERLDPAGNEMQLFLTVELLAQP